MKTPRRRFAGTVKVGEKGQIVIPKEIRELFSIQPGDSLLLLADTKQGIAILKDDAVFANFRDIWALARKEMSIRERHFEVRDLCKHYPAFSLQDVSFLLQEGAITGLIGRNGAGKSTTLKALLHFLQPDGGQVRFFGLPLEGNEPAIRAKVGYVAGGFRHYPRKKLRSITDVTRRFYAGWDEEVYRRCLRDFDLDESKTPSALSEGMKVKYALTLALSRRARLLMLDEPTSGLDPVSREDLLETLLGLARREEVTVLFSTHITSDLDKCADRILYLRQGRLAADTALEDFTAQYRLAESRAAIPGGLGQREFRAGYTALLPVGTPVPDGVYIHETTLEDIMVHLEKEGL